MLRKLAAARGVAPLRHRRFRLLFAGQLSSNIGDNFNAVALPWYVLAEHGGALLLGTVLAAYGISRAALLVVGGHASDRWRPWTVMMGTDAVRAVGVAGLAIAAALGPARAVILVPIAIVLGAGSGLFMPGSFAIVPELLPADDLQAGNALTSGGTQLATLIGPAIGGALVAVLGPAPAFAIDAASFAVSALTLLGIRQVGRTAAPAAKLAVVADGGEPATGQPVPDEPGGEQGAPAAGDGPTLRSVLRTERILQIGLLVTVAANLGSGGISEVALPSLAHGPLHAGAGGFGALLASFGAGALLGTIVAAQARQARRPFFVASFVFLVQAACIAVVPYLGTIGAGVAMAAFGLLNGFGNVLTITAFQLWAPPQLLGRLFGMLMLASLGIFPVSVALAALVVHRFGPAPFFPFAAIALAVSIIAALSQRTWRDFGIPVPAPTSSASIRPDAPAAADPMGNAS
jgi:predicted MFS family arabinose efflux permease